MTGEDYIGTFNPNDREDVAAVKAAATVLIDTIQGLENGDGRRKAHACTQVEAAAMFAVKSIYS